MNLVTAEEKGTRWPWHVPSSDAARVVILLLAATGHVNLRLSLRGLEQCDCLRIDVDQNIKATIYSSTSCNLEGNNEFPTINPRHAHDNRQTDLNPNTRFRPS